MKDDSLLTDSSYFPVLRPASIQDREMFYLLSGMCYPNSLVLVLSNYPAPDSILPVSPTSVPGALHTYREKLEGLLSG